MQREMVERYIIYQLLYGRADNPQSPMDPVGR